MHPQHPADIAFLNLNGWFVRYVLEGSEWIAKWVKP